MSVIIILIIVGVIVAGVFLVGFIWAVKSGQYDDMYSPSVRILFDDNNNVADKDSKNGDLTTDTDKTETNNNS
jgi:cbb3-type cytochrome oxidase maturation protein